MKIELWMYFYAAFWILLFVGYITSVIIRVRRFPKVTRKCGRCSEQTNRGFYYKSNLFICQSCDSIIREARKESKKSGYLIEL